MLVAMGIAAILCVAIGVYPWVLYDLLPFEMEYSPFRWQSYHRPNSAVGLFSRGFCLAQGSQYLSARTPLDEY
jgi:formate hydrogenlyase subunit 3/multisubunit Na+/H+ antiporter MnhD subunit